MAKAAANKAVKNFMRVAPILMNDILAAFPKLSVEDAAAIAGNGGHESDGLQVVNEYKPVVAGSRGGYHYFQWTGPRRKQFEKFCRDNGLKPNTYAAGLAFLVHELRTTEKKAIPALLAAKGLEAKVVAFERAYERAGVKAYEDRYVWARRAMSAWNAQNTATKSVVVPEPAPMPPPRPAEVDPEPAELPDEGKPLQGFMPASVIKGVQARLRELNYHMVGLVEGEYGEQMRAALIVFQRMNGLDYQNGDITKETLECLDHAECKPISPERANRTMEDLRKAGAPEVKEGDKAQGAAITTGILSALIAMLNAFGETFANIWSGFATAREALTKVVPTEVWAIIIAGLALYTIYKVQAMKDQRLKNERTGEHAGVYVPPKTE